MDMVEARQLPSPRESDVEEVHCALEVARTLWDRGDGTDALKWLRRAVEAAADQDADRRALELAKAAADVATAVSESQRPPAPDSEVPPSSSRASAKPAPAQDPAPVAVARQAARRRNRREDAEGDTVVRPQTALRRALTHIDPNYPARTDLRVDESKSYNAPALLNLAEAAGASGNRAAHDTDHDAAPLRHAEEACAAEVSNSQAVADSLPPPAEDDASAALTQKELARAAKHPQTAPRPQVPRPGNQPSAAKPEAVQQPLSLTVALLPIPEEGEVRLLFLAEGETPPPGVAIAQLVAASPSDAERIAAIYENTAAKL